MVSANVILIYPFFIPCFRTLKHSINRSNIAVVEHFIPDGLKCVDDPDEGLTSVDKVETEDEQLWIYLSKRPITDVKKSKFFFIRYYIIDRRFYTYFFIYSGPFL